MPPPNNDKYKTPRLLTRLAAWETASDLVGPIVDKHELAPVNIGGMFNVTQTQTRVSQHLNHIMDVADWLLNEGD